MPALDRAIADRVEYLQARHQFAASERADLEFAAGERGHAFAQGFRRVIQDVQALGEARRQPPANRR
ncbi:hypothetical protein SDC9_203002 [bioreactor metagenome]|uniref:Uncharacterized protein n=1 Tax=bioreactor metagenome TaxID=1076179 RepID=A0A645IWR1_9ZZZZ